MVTVFASFVALHLIEMKQIGFVLAGGRAAGRVRHPHHDPAVGAAAAGRGHAGGPRACGGRRARAEQARSGQGACTAFGRSTYADRGDRARPRPADRAFWTTVAAPVERGVLGAVRALWPSASRPRTAPGAAAGTPVLVLLGGVVLCYAVLRPLPGQPRRAPARLPVGAGRWPRRASSYLRGGVRGAVHRDAAALLDVRRGRRGPSIGFQRARHGRQPGRQRAPAGAGRWSSSPATVVSTLIVVAAGVLIGLWAAFRGGAEHGAGRG